MSEALLALISALIPIGPRDRIVELNCGSGDLSIELARRVPDGLVAALDSDDDAVRRARARAAEAGLDNVLFMAADQSIPWREGFFSVAVSRGLPSGLADVFRVLEPGGALHVIAGDAAAEALAQSSFENVQETAIGAVTITCGRKPAP